MRPHRLAIAACALMLAAGFVLAGPKTPLALEGTGWEFDDVTSRAKASNPELGKTKGKDPETRDVVISLQEGGNFLGLLDDLPMAAGTFSRKNEFARKVRLDINFVTADALETEYEEFIIDQIREKSGWTATLDLELVDAKGSMRIRPQAKKGLAHARMRFKLKFEGLGSVLGLGVNNSPTKVTGTLRGRSLDVPIENVLAPTPAEG